MVLDFRVEHFVLLVLSGYDNYWTADKVHARVKAGTRSYDYKLDLNSQSQRRKRGDHLPSPQKPEKGCAVVKTRCTDTITQ